MNRKREVKLKKIYDQIPKIKCQNRCQRSCREIALSQGEVKEIYKISGKPIKMENGHCNHLSERGGCTVYDNRPTIFNLQTS